MTLEITPDPVWDYVRQSCWVVGCDVELRLEQSALRHALVVQHGPNPEHRTEFDAATIMSAGQSNYLLAIRDWLKKVHAPRPWESDDDLQTHVE